MVNQTVLEYFRLNKGKYDLDKLKNKVLNAGYSQEDINEALIQLAKENKNTAPLITKPLTPAADISTVSFNKFLEEKPKVSFENTNLSTPVSQFATISSDSSLKSTKWLVITLIIVILILIGVGTASWYFLLR
jgi:uncharacterized protein Smg (DUF494 family)